jgi:DNA-binding MarR family transcriptional regulator
MPGRSRITGGGEVREHAAGRPWRDGADEVIAGMRMEKLNAEALTRFGIDGRELGILLVLASHEPGSQQQAAQRLGIDRTSMVARIDALEDKVLISRHLHAADRRRNVVELTRSGRDTLRRAGEASERAEAALLATLTAQQGERNSLQAIVAPGDGP